MPDRSAPPLVLAGATIAFDLDGTLVDTAPDLIGALNMVLGERGLAHVPEASARVLVGKGARALIARGFAQAGEPLADDEVAALVARFIEVYRTRIASKSRAYEGLDAALDRLAQAGATLCVCTNKRTDLSVALLDALGLTPRFAAVTGADKAPRPKPDPSHYLAAIVEAGGDVSRSMMVGDSENDVRSAHAAGAPVVLVDFGYTEIPAKDLGADAVIARFDQLPTVAQSLLARRPAASLSDGSPRLGLPLGVASAIDAAS